MLKNRGTYLIGDVYFVWPLEYELTNPCTHEASDSRFN